MEAVDITLDNFEKEYPNILNSIEKAEFLSFDFEYSGRQRFNK
jgi:hypothetical protein